MSKSLNNSSTKSTISKHTDGPMSKLGPTSQKAKDFNGSLKKLMKYLGKYKISIMIVFLFSILSTIFAVVGPKILGTATTEIYKGIMGKISGAGEGIDFEYIFKILLFLLFIYSLSFVFSYIQNFIMTSVSMKVTYNIRNQISQKINRMPMNYFDTTSHGEILSRVTNDVDTLSQSLNQSATQIIVSIVTIIGIVIMMFSISWQLTLTSLCVIPLSILFIFIIVKKSQKHFINQQNFLGNLNGHVEEIYGGHNVVRAFNGEEDSIKKFNDFNSKLYISSWKSQFLSGLIMPIINTISNFGYVIVCVFGGYLVTRNGLPIGDIQAFIQYVRQFTQPIVQISNISNVFQQTIACAERVFEFLEEEEQVSECEKPLNFKKIGDNNGVDIKGSVQFAHVKFGYNSEKIIIKDFSANIKSGQKVAIVGPTGAGKTTIVKLLMRFYDVIDGAILIDGYNIKHFTKDDLRSQFGMVLQETWLYNGTIKDNIRYGKLNASDEDIIKAAKSAQVDFFIHTLPDGYNMILNEDASNLSQGQKQLLTIARAILVDPKILILDEATSSVDNRTELMIQKAMNNLMKNRTSFVIAHRLSTIKDADLILVMDAGNIVEQGNHNELINKKGFYFDLYNSQFDC